MTVPEPDGEPGIPRRGALGGGDFPPLLRELVRRLRQTRMEVHAGGVKRTLWVDAGQVTAVVSDAEDEKLGAWLVRQRVMEAAPMALALLRQPEGVLFGAALVQAGLITPERLEKELAALAVSIVGRCLFAAGEYALVDGETVPFEAATLRMTTASLLVAAARRCGDVGALEAMARENAFVVSAGDALLRNQRAELQPAEGYLLSRIDGTTTVRQLARGVGLPLGAVQRSVAALATAGLVELRGEAADREPAPSGAVLGATPDPGGSQEYTPMQQREYEEIVRLAQAIRDRDFYRRLGVSPGATYDQIHVKYREMTELYHPDRAVEPHLRELRHELADVNACLSEAYSVLIHPDKRQRYDKLLKSAGVLAGERLQQQEQRASRRESLDEVLARADQMVKAGDLGGAVQLLDQAVRQAPDPRTLLLLARLELRNPLWTQRGLDHLRRAVTVAPQMTEGWLELAAFWGSRQQPEKQRQCLERILAYDAGNRQARAELSKLS